MAITEQPIKNTHPEYDRYLPQIQRCIAAYKGADEIKPYIIRPVDWSETEYTQYKDRANWFGAPARTLEAQVGLMTRKQPTVDLGALETYHTDIDNSGNDIELVVTRSMVSAQLAHRFILVSDWDQVDNRPYTTEYPAERCTNWHFDDNGNLDFLVLRDEEYVYDPTQKSVVGTTSYREYLLHESGVVVNIWRAPVVSTVTATGETSQGTYAIDEAYPLKGFAGRPVMEIPVTLGSSDGPHRPLTKPPMLDLVDVAISHYNNSADLEQALHWVGSPVPVFSGFDSGNNNENRITFSPSQAILLGDQGKAEFLEISGTALKNIQDTMLSKESQLANLGSRLTGRRDGVITAETARINAATDYASLSTIARGVSDSWTSHLTMMSRVWLGVESDEIKLIINTDFVSSRLSAEDLKTLTEVYLAGVITSDTFAEQLLQGEILVDLAELEKTVALLNSKPQTNGTTAETIVPISTMNNASGADSNVTSS